MVCAAEISFEYFPSPYEQLRRKGGLAEPTAYGPPAPRRIRRLTPRDRGFPYPARDSYPEL